MSKQKRVAIYISEEEYDQLRSRLILQHETVSGWFRKQAKEFLKQSGTETSAYVR